MEELEIKLRNLIIEKYGNVKSFAASIGMPYTTIDSILKRGIQKANIENVIKICSALEISVDDLARGIIQKKTDAPVTLAAHFDGEAYTEEELEKIREFAQFVRLKRYDEELQLIQRTGKTPAHFKKITEDRKGEK